jgi:mannose-6-phosphate isomerase
MTRETSTAPNCGSEAAALGSASAPKVVMPNLQLYPLRFAPIYQYRLWGGRELTKWFKTPLPGDDPIGEAWVLSDRNDHASTVAEGALKGRTIAQLIEQAPEPMLGKYFRHFSRFPLLLKFLDVQEMLSVQVHPSDSESDLIPKGETGKTEAWVVLEAKSGSLVYAGLKPGVTPGNLRVLSMQTVNDCLSNFPPSRGQAIVIDAGTVHSVGKGVVLFEIQENSDVTFRLYDWDHIDPKSRKRRPLQLDQALACVDFAQGQIRPVEPVMESGQPVRRERLFDCSHFKLWRVQSAVPFTVGAADAPRVLVCLEGLGSVEHIGETYAVEKGAVMLLPASVGVCRFEPTGGVTILEIALPDHA